MSRIWFPMIWAIIWLVSPYWLKPHRHRARRERERESERAQDLVPDDLAGVALLAQPHWGGARGPAAHVPRRRVQECLR